MRVEGSSFSCQSMVLWKARKEGPKNAAALQVQRCYALAFSCSLKWVEEKSNGSFDIQARQAGGSNR
jgi:hypothetical protein